MDGWIKRRRRAETNGSSLLIPLLFTATLCQSSHEQMVESLRPGSSLHANQTLVSSNGTFSLGFFSLLPGRNYLGVSYHEISFRTQIWAANRDNPAGDGAVLIFSSDGDLVLRNSDQSVVWGSGTGGTNATSLVMEEYGNVVLYEEAGRVVWQSFDHPTDTWVPGMKMYLGSNLTSARSVIDPGEGRFSLQMLRTTEFVSVWNSSVQYWTSGAWNGHIFSFVPEMTISYHYNFSFVDDSSGVPYFTWSEYSDFHSHFVLESDGNIRVRIWDDSNARWYTIWTQPKDPCQVDHLCGQNGICDSDFTTFCSCPYGFRPVDPGGWRQGDWSLGCVAERGFECGKGHFSLLEHTYYDQGKGGGHVKSYGAKGQDECQVSCTNDCACVGFSMDPESGDCTLQYGGLFNGKTSSAITQSFFLRVNINSLDRTTNSTKSKSKKVRIVVLAAAMGGGSFLLVATLLFLILHRSRHRQSRSPDYTHAILVRFSHRDLQLATNNFSQSLGEGAFGSVYKGTLRDHTPVAVKKLHNIKQGDKDFRTEVTTLGTIQHLDLVRLRGFCAEKLHRLLVYDHMPNGSLNSVLFSKPGKPQQVVLDWATRYAIAVATARGISYLHEECRKCIIHCDIKPENILLDANFRAKVADFGLAKLFGREFSAVITSMRGTRGYLAPEWLSGVAITTKADVYSYGMTLLEIISGRRNINVDSTLEEWFFPLWACKQAQVGNFLTLADPKLKGALNEDQLRAAVLCAIWCIQDEETTRPSMARVVQMLEGTLEVAHPPYPKSYLMLEGEMNNPNVSEMINPIVSLSMPNIEEETTTHESMD